jgi:hypothetical protein
MRLFPYIAYIVIFVGLIGWLALIQIGLLPNVTYKCPDGHYVYTQQGRQSDAPELCNVSVKW